MTTTRLNLVQLHRVVLAIAGILGHFRLRAGIANSRQVKGLGDVSLQGLDLGEHDFECFDVRTVQVGIGYARRIALGHQRHDIRASFALRGFGVKIDGMPIRVPKFTYNHGLDELPDAVIALSQLR